MSRLMQQWFDQAAVESLGWTLVHFLWQGAAVALLLAILLTLLRRSPATIRYLSACLAFLIMAALPIATFLFLAHRPTPTITNPPAAASPTTPIFTEMPSRPIVNPPLAQPPHHLEAPLAAISLQARLRPALPWLVTGWLLGASVLSVRLVGGWTRLHALKREASPPPGEWSNRLASLAQRLRIGQPIKLLAIAHVDAPCTLGWLKPVILIPAGVLCTLSPQQLEAILAHELAHIRRHDYLVNLLQSALEALLFYHPAVWWVSRQIRIEREHCCDDIAAQACGNPLLYARALATLEELRLLPPTLAPAATTGPLLLRIRRLLSLPTDRRAPWWPAGALALIALGSLAMGLRLSHANAAPTTQPTTRPTFIGTVTTLTGEPIANAQVSLVLPLPKVIDSVTTSAVRTRPDGSFRLGAPEPLDLSDGLTELVIEANGYAINSAYIGIREEAVPTREIRVMPVQMKPEAQLHVQFIGPDDKPIAGLKVMPYYVRERATSSPRGEWHLSIPQDVRDRMAGRTDANGACTLTGLPRQSAITLHINDTRFAQLNYESRVLTDKEANANASIRLKAAASIKGRVIYGDTGKPAPGVTVFAGSVGIGSPQGFGQSVTNEQGEYEIKQLSASNYNVLVHLDGEMHESWTANAIENVTTAEGQQVEHRDFSLIKGGLITGKVVLKDTGKPLPNVAVGLLGPSRPRSGGTIDRAITRPDGSFSIRVPGGQQYLYLQDWPPAGYLRPDPIEPQIADGQTMTVTLEVPQDPSPPVAGRVVDTEGKPVADAIVVANPGDGYAILKRDVEMTDKEGRFRFAGLAAESRLRASKGNLGTIEPVVTHGQEDNLILRLQKDVTPTLLVTVEDTTGKAIKGARLWMTYWEDSGLGSKPNDPIGVTDAQGHCLLPKLSLDRRYTLTVTADGFPWDAAQNLPVKLTPGQQNTMKVVLRPASR